MNSQNMKHPVTRGFHYAWVVAGITFLTLIVAAAVRATPSILIVPLEREFGWSPATISFAISVNILLYGLIGPFAAGLLNRYGARRVMLASLAFLACGVALTTLIRVPWQLVLLLGRPGRNRDRDDRHRPRSDRRSLLVSQA
jgi:MFS family permease